MRLFYSQKGKGAFTLVELLISIGISTIILSSVIALFNSGIDAWVFGQKSVEAQVAASQIMETITEGSFRFDGLREALEITGMEEDSLRFIPWWRQEILSIRVGEKIKLERSVDLTGPVPVAQVWNSSKERYEFAGINYYPEMGSSKKANSFISFINEDFEGQRGRVFFYPSKEKAKEVEMRIYLHKEKKRLYQSYRGRVKEFSRIPQGVFVKRFYIEYLDGANEAMEKGYSGASDGGFGNVRALRFQIETEKEDYLFALRSMVNIRRKGIANTGVFLKKGSKLPIPNSLDVRTLSVVNLVGVGKDSYVYLLISSKSEAKTYGLKLLLGQKEGLPWIDSLTVEYPRGKKVFSQVIDQPALRGVNLLTLDFSGLYDYGVDDDALNEVIFQKEDVVLELKDTDIDGISILSR